MGLLVRATQKNLHMFMNSPMDSSMTKNSQLLDDPQKFMYHQRIIPLYHFSFKMIYKIFTSLNFVIIVKLVYYTSLKFNLHESSYLEFV